MKLTPRIRLTAFPLLTALLLSSVAACSSSATEPETKPTTEALKGGDRASFNAHLTEDVTPLDQIDVKNLGLLTDGVISVGTLSDAKPSIYLDENGKFTGFDNELLRAMAAKLGLEVEFASTDFVALLPQVQNKKFDVGSSSISTTDARREVVAFTNGYDFGYMAVVARDDSGITGVADLTDDVRIGVVQSTVQDDYLTNGIGIEPVRFPDYNSLYQNLKVGQLDGWLAPSNQASGIVQEGDGISIVETTINTENYMAYAVSKNNPKLLEALNSALDAVVADGTWKKLNDEWWDGRVIPDTWKPGSVSVKVGEAAK